MQRKPYQHSLDVFNGGSMTVISDARLGKKPSNTKFAVEATNLMQYEDGVWGPRPGTTYYGKSIPGGGIDRIAQYTKADKTRVLLAFSIDGKGYVSADDGSTWTEVTGATWTPGHQFDTKQFKSELWITNGFDPLVYYDEDGVFKPFTAIADPVSAPSLTRGAGLTTGNYKYYLRYTANNKVGWSSPSPVLEIAVNKPREAWVLADNEYCDYAITAVTDGESYDLWLGDVSGKEYHLGSTTDLVFKDTGTPVNTFQEIPDDNTTAAPKVSSLELSGSRLWATKDDDNPWRYYGTGTSQYLGYFSPFYGGFWGDLERGGEYYPTSVVHYRTGKGDPIATVLCSSADGNGTIFQVELTTTTIGDVNITVPVAYKLVGSKGADASGAVVKFGDNVGFLNKKSLNFLRNKEQLFNVLATDDMTAPFRDKFKNLNAKQIHKAIGYYRSPHLMFSVPMGEENDTTFVWDDERRNLTWCWTIGFKQITEYTDSGLTTHLLGVRCDDDQIIEITENSLSDLGQEMFCQYISPLIPIDPKDHRTQARIKESIFEMGELRGSVTCAVLGRTKKTDIAAFGYGTVQSTFSNSGIGDDLFSDVLFSDTGDMPKTFSSSSRKKTVKVNKKLYAYKYRVTSKATNSSWRLLSIQSHGRMIFKKAPGSWRKE